MFAALFSLVSIPVILHQLRFAAAGLIATGVNWAALWTLLVLAGLGGLAAVAVAFFLSTGVNFILQKFWTFRAHRSRAHGRQLGAYFAMAGVSFGFNEGLYALFAGPAHLNYVITQALITVVLGLVGYVSTKYIFTLPLFTRA